MYYEEKIALLLECDSQYLTSDEKAEVLKGVSSKEYFLAVQSFLFGFISESRPLSRRALDIIEDLMGKMGVKDEDDDDYWLWEEFDSAVKRIE